MYKFIAFVVLCVSYCCGYPTTYLTQTFRVGVEYDHSLPMSGESDRYRHRNNYDPFYVTVIATAKTGYVLDYLEIEATVDAMGEITFCLIQGDTGSKTMIFQLSSNNSDFMKYKYQAYGIREDEYKKVANHITIPFQKEK